MSKFWQLLEKSTITSGALAVMLVGSMCYLAVTSQPIPDLLTVSTSTVLGFFFGAKVERSYRVNKLEV